MACNLRAYRAKSDEELLFIVSDAHEAAVAMHSLGDAAAECKYLDQINDASTVLHERRQVAA